MQLKRMSSYGNHSGLKKLFFSHLYRSSSQTKEEFEKFCTDLNLLFSNVIDLNILLSVINRDFNERTWE